MLAFFALALAAQSAPASDPEAVRLEEVVVVGEHATGLLSVVVDGQADAQALVVSEPDLRCGPEAWRWEAYGRPRLCWLRRRLDSTVTLSATWAGRPPSGWAVDWQGCERLIAPDRCEVAIRAATEVRATYRRL